MAEQKKRTSSVGAAVFMIGAVVFAGLAGLLLSRLLTRQYPGEGMVKVVVAARDAPAGQPLKGEDLRLAPMVKSTIPKGAFATVKAVLARQAVPLVPLVAGAAVLESQLARPRSGIGVAAKLEPGERAISFLTDSSVALARLVYPGARVDLLATMRRRGTQQNEVKTRVLLQNVRVLALGQDIDAMSAFRETTATKQRGLAKLRSTARDSKAAHRVVTVAVTVDQAERVALASREGKIDVVLRAPQDISLVESAGATPEEILGDEEPNEAEVGGVVEQSKAPRRRGPRVRRKPRPRPKPAPAAPAGPTIYRGGGG